MKQDNRLAKLGDFTLLITLIALILVANTYAKYTTAKDFESSATVAKWSIKLNGKDITQNEEVAFDLFKTIKDTDNSIETDVTSGKIAPGTQGSFDIKVRNDSEVTAEYEISFTTENNNAIPVEFSTDGTNWKNDISEITLSEKLASNTEADQTTTIYWRWAFVRGTETADQLKNNSDDTKLATAATTPKLKVTAHLSAEQAD